MGALAPTLPLVYICADKRWQLGFQTHLAVFSELDSLLGKTLVVLRELVVVFRELRVIWII